MLDDKIIPETSHSAKQKNFYDPKSDKENGKELWYVRKGKVSGLHASRV